MALAAIDQRAVIGDRLRRNRIRGGSRRRGSWYCRGCRCARHRAACPRRPYRRDRWCRVHGAGRWMTFDARRNAGKRLAVLGQRDRHVLDGLVHGIGVKISPDCVCSVGRSAAGSTAFRLDSMSTLPKRYCGPSSILKVTHDAFRVARRSSPRTTPAHRHSRDRDRSGAGDRDRSRCGRRRRCRC